MVFKEKFFQNSAIVMFASVAIGALGYIFHFVVSRKLSVGEYGELQSLLSLFTIFTVFSAALSNFVVKYSSVFASAQDKASSHQFFRLLSKKITKINLILMVAVMLISPFLVKILHLSGATGLIIIALSTAIGISTVLYRGTLLGWQDFFSTSRAGIIGTFVKLLAGFLIVIHIPTASAVAWSLLLASAAGWALNKYYYSKKLKIGQTGAPQKAESWDKKYFSGIDLRKTILPIFLFSLALIIAGNIDILLVKNLTTPEMTGHYGALSTLGKIMLWLNLAVISVVLPDAFASGNGGKRIESKILWQVYGVIILMSSIAIAAFLIAPDFIIGLLFGSKYAVFSGDLWIFGAMAFFLSVLSLESNLSYARHDFRVTYILCIVVLAMLVGIFYNHSSVREMAAIISVIFASGFFATLFMNIRHRKETMKENTINNATLGT